MHTNPQSSSAAGPDAARFTRFAYGMEEAAELLSLSHRTVWRLCNTGELLSLKVGGRRLIPATAIQQFVQSRTTQGITR